MTREAFEELYVRFGPAVRARCRAMCGDTDADEALQDAFLRAWRARAGFDGRHPLAWLQTIARNACIDLLRKRRPWADDPAWLGVAGPGPDLARPDVTRLLERLSPEDAALLRLRYVEDWRIHELAEHFDTSQRTLRRELERVEAEARALLGADDV